MTPDVDVGEVAESSPTPAEPEEVDPTTGWYDRSSLRGDFMVMIAGQTEEEYLRRCPEARFCEYINGVVYMPSPVDAWHQFDTQMLYFLLEGFACDHPMGPILTGPAALRLSPACYVEPDLFILPVGAEAQIHGVFCDPPALLVVEVLSRSTRSHDLTVESEMYREAGTIEVWFVDPRDRVLIVHRRTDEGYVLERSESGPYRSVDFPGFWFEVSWPWARPRPNPSTCLEAILAGPPA